MRTAAVVLLGWGVWLGLLTAVQAPFGPRWIVPVMLAAAAAACLLAGGGVWALELRARRRRAATEGRLIGNSSYAVMTLTVGASLALIGAGFGLWLILMGAGIAALGAGGVVREMLGRRRASRERSVR